MDRDQQMIGRTLSHFKITAKLGEGGMGEVYLAEDTKLGREVAVKMLPTEVAADPERLERFKREAKSVAALNHPNIVTIHSVEEADGHHLLAMELVEGKSLDQILPAAGFDLPTLFPLAIQIAGALAAAHDKGITHRDLKPANVMVTAEGRVKVLDFGLAKLAESDAEDAETELMTRDGMILGTVPYMSPEQVQGRSLDHRSDIFSLGILLYEMATGQRPFQGDNRASVISAVLKDQPPPVTELRAALPNHLGRIVRRCLEKGRQRRYQAARDVQLELEGLEKELTAARDAGGVQVASALRSDQGPDSLGSATGSRTPRTWLTGSMLPWALVAALVIALAWSLIGRTVATATPSPEVSRWTIPLPADTRIDLPGPGGKFDYSNAVAISRDGSRVAFSVIDRQNRVQLYLKADAADPRPIPGTTNARAPFFSPDGNWLGFYADGKIWKVALRGGAPQEVCDVVGRAIAFDAAWSPDGETIVFTEDGVWRVSVSSGVPERLTAPDPERGELGHHTPRFTADGEGVLFTVSGSGQTSLALMPLDGKSWEILLRDAAMGVAVGVDRIVFARSGELFASPFNQGRPQVIGPAVPVLQGVHTSPGLGGMVMTWFDVSDTGTLTYVPAAAARPDEQLMWVDLDGTETVIAEGNGTWVHPRLSPDHRRISLDIHSADGMRDVYIYELERRQFQQLTHTGVTWESEWRPDGEVLAILSGAKAGLWSLYQVRADFSGPPELLAQTDHAIPGSWLDGGRALLYTEWNEGGFYRLQVEGERTTQMVLGTDRRQGFPRVSPDGKWVAYVADESSLREVFVQSYPEMGAIHKVSIEGGREPLWSRDGRRLFYRKGKQMLVARVTHGPAIAFGRPEVLFEGEYDAAVVGHQHYDISHDDSRFLMVRHGEPVGPREVRIVLNWGEEMRALVSDDVTE